MPILMSGDVNNSVKSGRNKAERFYWSFMVALGTGMMDGFMRPELVVDADARISEKIKKAIPSAFAAPNVTGNNILDNSFNAGFAGASIYLSSEVLGAKKVLIGTLAAQAASCGLNEIVAEAGGLSRAESRHQDVGFSGPGSLLVSNYLFTKEARAQDLKDKLPWRVGIGLFIGGMTVAAYFADRPHATLNLGPHALSTVAGYITSENIHAKKIRGNLKNIGSKAINFLKFGSKNDGAAPGSKT